MGAEGFLNWIVEALGITMIDVTKEDLVKGKAKP